MDITAQDDLYTRLSQRLERRLTLLNEGVREEDLATACRDSSKKKAGQNKNNGMSKRKKERRMDNSAGLHQNEWMNNSCESWTPSGRLGCAAVAAEGCLFVFGGIGNGSARVKSYSARMYSANTAIYEVDSDSWSQVLADPRRENSNDVVQTVFTNISVQPPKARGSKVHKAAKMMLLKQKIRSISKKKLNSTKVNDGSNDMDESGDPVSGEDEEDNEEGAATDDDDSEAATPQVDDEQEKDQRSIFTKHADGGVSLGAGGEMNNIPRAGMTANLMDDGKIIIFGGESGFKTAARQVFNMVFLFDVHERTFAQLHPKGLLPSARRGHSAVLSYTEESRRLIVFGGAGPNGVSKRDHYFNDVNVLDLEDRVWSKPICTGVVPSPRFGHCAFHVPGVKHMYMWGGMSAEIVSVRGQPKMATSSDERSELFEQDDLWAPFAAPVMYALNLETFEWSVVEANGPAPEARWGHTVALCPTAPDIAFIFGGQTFTGVPTNEVLAFDTTGNTWHTVDTRGSIPSARYGHACDMYGNTMMVYGGCGHSSYCSSTVHCIQLPDTITDPSVRNIEYIGSYNGAPINNFNNINNNNNNRAWRPSISEIDGSSLWEKPNTSTTSFKVRSPTQVRSGSIAVRNGSIASHGPQSTGGPQNMPYGLDERSASSVGMLGPLQQSSILSNLGTSNSMLGYCGIPISEMPRPRSSPYESKVLSRIGSKRQLARKGSITNRMASESLASTSIHESFRGPHMNEKSCSDDKAVDTLRRESQLQGRKEESWTTGGRRRRDQSYGPTAARGGSAGCVAATTQQQGSKEPWWLSQLAGNSEIEKVDAQRQVSTLVTRPENSRAQKSSKQTREEEMGNWVPLSESSWARRCVTAPAERSSALSERRAATLQTMESVLHGYNLDFADSRARLRRLNIRGKYNTHTKNEIAEIRQLFEATPEITSALAVAAAQAARKGLASKGGAGGEGGHTAGFLGNHEPEIQPKANPSLSRFVFKSPSNGGVEPRTPGRAGLRFTISSAMRPTSPAAVLYNEVQRLPRVQSALSRPLTRRPLGQ